MRLKTLSLGVVTCVVLAACGGGGGGGQATATPQVPVPSVPTGPAAVVISEATAKNVGAHATEAAQSGASTQNALSLVGVQVDESGAGTPPVLWVVGAARALAPIGDAAAGVTVDQTRNCPLGGTVRMQATISNEQDLSAGDVIAMTAVNCKLTVSGVTNTMGGSMTLKVNSASKTATSVRANMTLTTNAMSVQSGSDTVVITGDQTLDLNDANGTSTLGISGANASTSITTGTGTRTISWKNFRHTFISTPTAVTANVSGTVESDSTKLGATGGSYVVSTPTTLSWSPSTGTMLGGVMKILGASNSQMQITFSSTGAVIAVDANGDGTFEKTFSATPAELKALL